jgi:hypothetical protein
MDDTETRPKTLLDQIDELSSVLSRIKKQTHFSDSTLTKIAELVFNNYWTARQIDLQAQQLFGNIGSPVPEPPPIPDDFQFDAHEFITGDDSTEETA